MFLYQVYIFLSPYIIIILVFYLKNNNDEKLSLLLLLFLDDFIAFLFKLLNLINIFFLIF